MIKQLHYLILLFPGILLSATLTAKNHNYTNYFIFQSDTTTNPYAKIIMSNGNESIEFSPLDSITKGALIEPVNRNGNKGLSTTFYLSDSSFWSFYTNANERLVINGDGNILTRSTLLVNNAIADQQSAMRVNGQARFDTALIVRAESDTGSFISIERNIQGLSALTYDRMLPYAGIPTAWAEGRNIPVFRIRHPNNVFGSTSVSESTARDFMIYPYQYGTAIEYNGVVECWVGEWSIHKGLFYGDVEGKGNGWGAVEWIGDDIDNGGVRTTARNNTLFGGNVHYGEISVEKFTGDANGDFRLRLPSTNNSFQFVYGERGSTNIIAKISNSGLVFPVISTTDSITTAEKAQLVYDTTSNGLKVYDGDSWAALLTDNILKTGTYQTSSDGTENVFKITHGLNVKPGFFTVMPTSTDASNFNYCTADNIYIYIHYQKAPHSGNNNLSWNWIIRL